MPFFFSVISFVHFTVCVSQKHCQSHRSTTFNAHGTNCRLERPQIVRKSSRTGLDVSPSVLVEPGTATCASRGMTRPCRKSMERTYQVRVQYTITLFEVVEKIYRVRPQRALQAKKEYCCADVHGGWVYMVGGCVGG